MLTPETQNTLRAAEWYPGHIANDCETIITKLRADGLLNEPAEAFIREFNGLKLDVSVRGSDKRGCILLRLDQVINFGVPQRDDMVRLFGEVGCPVGWFCLNDMFIMPSGRVGFVDYDWTVCGVLGLNIESAFEALCDGRCGVVGGWELDEQFRPTCWLPPPRTAKAEANIVSSSEPIPLRITS